MAQDIFTVQMSQRAGRWRLYVVLYGETCWPEHYFTPGPAVPTLTERTQALDALGYRPVGDDPWEWTETSEDYEDPSSPVVLIAATTVEEVTSWNIVR
jgi:uncharacterized protein DUF6303